MIIEEYIQQLLVPSVLSRLYPMIAPDAAQPPYTNYFLMNAQNLTTHTSPLPLTRMWRMQFSTWSPRYAETRTISNSIQAALVGYTDSTIMGVSQLSEHGTWDEVAKFFGWTVELLITENVAP